jgi:molecular chaperone DnaK
MPQIEVTFDIDANGIVNVSAKDKATNKEQKITIQASGGLSEEDIKKMVKDAEEHAQEDKQRRELVEAQNQASSLIYSTEKSLAEHGDKVSDADKKSIQEAIKDLQSVVDKENKEEIDNKTQALMQASMKMGEAIYKSAQSDAPADGEAGESAQSNQGDGKVVDAEFEEVKDDDSKK